MTLYEMKMKYLRAKEAYYNSVAGKTLMSDAEFDALEEKIRKLEPKWPELKKTGTKVGKKSKVKLPVMMPSLDKIKADETDRLSRWLGKFSSGLQITISPKLDGSSLQLEFEGGVPTKLATRGDGIEGKDISYFIPALIKAKRIPAGIDTKARIIVRCEALMEDKVFAKKWSTAVLGEKEGFDSARAAVAGVFNRQDVHPAMADIHIVALRMLRIKGVSDDVHPRHSKGLSLLLKYAHKLEQVPYITFNPEAVSVDVLVKRLGYYRKTMPYSMDGLALCIDATDLPITADKPKWATAFKLNDAEGKLTTITGFVWELSHTRKIVPKATVAPIKFEDGTTVKNVSVSNPRLCIKNGWGVGAEVRIIKSGDIIPKIIATPKPVKFKTPTVKEVGHAFEWDANEVHYMLKEGESERHLAITKIKKVIDTLNLDFLGESAAREIAATFSKPTVFLERFVDDAEDALLDCGLSRVIAKKVEDSLPESYTLAQYMEASGLFPSGLGSRRFALMEPMMMDPINNYKLYRSFDGMDERAIELLGTVMGAKFNEGRDDFIHWFVKAKLPVTQPVAKKTIKGKLTGQVFSMTGYRDKDEVAAIEKAGGQVVDFSSKTTTLLYRDTGKKSSKIATAEKKGIAVKTFAELKL